ncbi:hypothetical protein [Acetobacterium woodii]|uniref:hypothetical protein n=1 Tax=Acetobacterium woodii TaxID=33952 RepID=UPI0002E48E12|nr:hypothetical protein [Acetobacterium woodii]
MFLNAGVTDTKSGTRSERGSKYLGELTNAHQTSAHQKDYQAGVIFGAQQNSCEIV